MIAERRFGETLPPGAAAEKTEATRSRRLVCGLFLEGVQPGRPKRSRVWVVRVPSGAHPRSS